MTIGQLMEQVREMGTAKRAQQEIACLDREKHRVLVMTVAAGHTFTYCGDCLLLFIDDIAVNSTVAR